MRVATTRHDLASVFRDRRTGLRSWIAFWRAQLVLVTALAALLITPSAGAVRLPTDLDVVDYLAFVTYMGPTAHPCWTYEFGRRPNVYAGIMFA